jgi:hypothetical protein
MSFGFVGGMLENRGSICQCPKLVIYLLQSLDFLPGWMHISIHGIVQRHPEEKDKLLSILITTIKRHGGVSGTTEQPKFVASCLVQQTIFSGLGHEVVIGVLSKGLRAPSRSLNYVPK